MFNWNLQCSLYQMGKTLSIKQHKKTRMKRKYIQLTKPMESNLLQNTLLRTCPRQGFSHQATAATKSNSSNVVANRGINSMDEAKSSTCGICT